MKILGSLYETLRGKNGPMDQGDDYQEADRTYERLYEEHGKDNTRLHPKDQVRQRRSQRFTETEERSERVDPKTNSRWYDHLSTSSSSQIGKQLHGGNLHHGMSDLFSLTSNGDSLVSDRAYKRRQTRKQCHVPAHVSFLTQCSLLVVSVFVISPHMHNKCMWLKGLTAEVTME